MSSSLVQRTAKNNQHVRSACTRCRRKHVKCDGKQPRCSKCAEKGCECAWTVDQDRRIARGDARKQCEEQRAYIEQLEARIDFLTRQLGTAEAPTVHGAYTPPGVVPNPLLLGQGLSNQPDIYAQQINYVQLPFFEFYPRVVGGRTVEEHDSTVFPPRPISGTEQEYFATQDGLANTPYAPSLNFTADVQPGGGMSGLF